MSGTLILEEHSIRNSIPPLLSALALSAVIMAAAARRLSLTGGARGAMTAALAYILFRLLYPALSDLLPGGGRREVPWEVTRDVLVLDGEIIPRSHIRHVYIWPNRDALGNTRPGYLVNLERHEGHDLLRSLTRGADAEASAAGLVDLVKALGYPAP